MSGTLPTYGPLPRPSGLDEALAVLAKEAFPAPTGVYEVEFTCEEFTAICPRTGQPDFGSVTITYCPRQFCLESKALKFYLWAWRDEGAFTETLAARICADVFDAIHPDYVRVAVVQRPRGGIGLRALAEQEYALAFAEDDDAPTGPRALPRPGE